MLNDALRLFTLSKHKKSEGQVCPFGNRRVNLRFFVRKRLGTEKEEFMMIVKAGKGILTKVSKNTGGEYT